LELKKSLTEKERISGYLVNILESLTSGVLAIDLEGKITLFNRAAGDVLEYQSGDVIGKPYLEVVGRRVEEKLTLPYILKNQPISQKNFDSGVKGEKEITTKTGKKIPVGFSMTLLKDNEGKVIGAVEEFFDLTRSKRMEEEMMRIKALAALGEMTAVVVHEVKNPLGGIRGFADLLDRDIPEGDPRKRLVKKITEGVETLDRIVLSLLEGTKPVKLNSHQVELRKFIDETVTFFEMDATRIKSNIRIKKRYTQNDLLCPVDVEQFRQVLLNLLHNAVQAMPDGGEIIVELKDESALTGNDKVEKEIAILRISDTGIGMSLTTKEKLFVPFYTTKERGTGLGLATVKKIVEAHQGDIQIESEAGKGTVVQIRLPAEK
jgi:PAS domain S-box-containing protein